MYNLSCIVQTIYLSPLYDQTALAALAVPPGAVSLVSLEQEGDPVVPAPGTGRSSRVRSFHVGESVRMSSDHG